ncbi:MAG: hypothetical protein HY720_05630 [Planctomycetes bacterium]|nr:hypothetical protein [Planctomycetota bacterium]
MSRWHPFRARRGESIVEITAAAAILAIAILGMANVFLVTSSANATSRETALATEAARDMLETLLGANFDAVTGTYGPGGAVGPNFEAPGLTAAPGDSDGRPGYLRFLVNETENTPESNELGIPGLDLDGDGRTSSTNVARDANPADGEPDYEILPVSV